MDKAGYDGHIKCFNMREGAADEDKDVNLWARDLEDVVLEIIEDPVFKAASGTSIETAYYGP
jgi:hypothetical protein